MDFPTPLTQGLLLRRYKRFLADVELPGGEVVVAHCPNTGSMKSCLEEGAPVWLSRSTNPKRKLAWTWEVAVVGGVPILVNTARPNAVVREAVASGRVPSVVGYGSLRSEVRYGTQNSRIDLFLSDGPRPDCYLEVKNVTLAVGGGEGAFPDAVSKRGTKHLEELAEMVSRGHRGLLFFLVSRGDVERVRPADEIDPVYGETLRRVVAAGVEVEAWRAEVSLDGVRVSKRLAVTL